MPMQSSVCRQVTETLHYGEEGSTEELLQWDARIGGICARLNACVEAVLSAHPKLAEA